ncbi:hypothetical protein FEDK69T_19880 [Flavobacterium enshiense DK69]|uniref:Lipoprotein n=1 Tax=Flavobacterium enshiense DK69 TaxID=1107311 RepID=V6S7S0_9FLAO|nr:hypothetical protein [Flavobacterium enshiense]ESU22728.1 hypothetical protein FEDK69T_19880 [Flavobacterium enshiense DK69]KGO95576.1 hypothetical protein Q767_10115 [Flavobacterium enshiense DK69]
MKNSIAIGNLKSLGFSCLALIAGLFIYSCSDDDDGVPPDTTTSRTPYVCPTCASTSQALPENDNAARGIYKGVFSEGTIAINFRNDVQMAYGVVYYKNRIISLSESPVLVEATEKPFFASLRGVYENSPVTLTFSVDEDGSNPMLLDFTIAGNSTFSSNIFKEKSTTLIEDYEGNYFLSANANPSGGLGQIPVPDLDSAGRVDPGLALPSANAPIVGNLRLVLSRSDGMWTLFKTMNKSNSVLDFGTIESGSLVSTVSGKRAAYLRSDEVNFSEYTPSGRLFLHAERKR